MSSPLRTALIGCGRIGAQTDPRLRRWLPEGWFPLSHLDAITSTPGLELIALCDLDQAALARASEAHPTARPYTDYEKLLAEERVDVLAIATRTEGRCAILEAAARSGVRGVHAEKPLGRSRREVERALTVAHAHGMHVSYGTTRRYMDVYRAARELVGDGTIGELSHVSVELGAAPLLWVHPHTIDAILFFAGSHDVVEVQAGSRLDPAALHGNVVDADPIVEHAFLRLANGVTGALTSVPGNDIVLAGSRATIRIVADGAHLEISTPPEDGHPFRTKRERRDVKPTLSGTCRAFHDLAAAVHGRGPLSITKEEILANTETLLAIVASSIAGGARVVPAAVDPDFTVTGRAGDRYA